MSSISSLFRRPLLIYDDKCYSCTKFAKAAQFLSRGRIRIAGHYYSQDAKEAKDMIFPQDYDATMMFWLINKAGAHGARSGLPQVFKEILAGVFLGGGGRITAVIPDACEYRDNRLSCYTPTNVIKRLVRLLSHGATFPFEKN